MGKKNKNPNANPNKNEQDGYYIEDYYNMTNNQWKCALDETSTSIVVLFSKILGFPIVHLPLLLIP